MCIRDRCGSVDLCAKASLRTGSGLVYNICPNSISDILQIKAVENIVLPISDDNKGCFTFRYIDEIIDKISNLDAIATVSYTHLDVYKRQIP